MKPSRAKVSEQVFAIGDRGGGGESVVLLMPLVRHLLAGNSLPEDFAAGAVQADDDELVNLSRGLRCGGRSGVYPGRNGCQEKNPVAPNDGCGIALSGDTGFPPDVLGFAPGHRRVRVGRFTRRERPAPLRPKEVRRRVRQGGGVARQPTCQRGQEERETASKREQRGDGRGSTHTPENIFDNTSPIPQNIADGKLIPPALARMLPQGVPAK